MPHSSDSPKVADLIQEAERNRVELAHTVHCLRDATADLGEKFAPTTIKANLGDYMRTRGEDMLEAARQNPLQAAAVGAIAAYPALALARRIPAPLMMIGAGLFLMNSPSGRNLSQKAAESAGALAEQGRRMAHDLQNKSADAFSSAVEQAASVGASIGGSVSGTSGAAGEYLDQTRSALADAGAHAQSGLRDAAYGLTSNARDLGRNVVDATHESASAVAEALTNWARKNPMMAAAIGMALGGLAASALPATRVEARIGESASGDLRRRLGDAVAQGVATATGTADQIAERTSQQGLTPQAVGEAARDYGERAQGGRSHRRRGAFAR